SGEFGRKLKTFFSLKPSLFKIHHHAKSTHFQLLEQPLP
ncbi:MAG: hypothetical protein ACI9JY_002077, partial [Saprospiraceae bacterium]